MKYLPREVGTVWVYSTLGMSLGLSKPILSLPLVGGIYHTHKLAFTYSKSHTHTHTHTELTHTQLTHTHIQTQSQTELM